MNWESFTKSLAVVVAVALVVFIGFSIYRVFVSLPKSDLKVKGDELATLDANLALKAILDTLETAWERRQGYRFRVNQDPLHLGRVIKDFEYSRKGKIETEEEDKIRLTATVIDENPKAIIKYNGKSYVVQAGDYLGKIYRVIKIEKMQVVLDNNGKRLVLVNKPVAKFRDLEEDSEYSDNAEFHEYNY